MKKLLLCLFIVMSGAMNATTIKNLDAGPTSVATTTINSACGAANGSLTIGSVTGGVVPYTYSFNGGGYGTTTTYSGLVAGTYTLDVKDANGDIYSTAVTITDNPGPTAIATTIVNATCGFSNGCLTLGRVTGGTPPYEYNLNNSTYTNTTNYCGFIAGTYSLDVKDANGCIYSTTITITDTPGPTSIVTTSTDGHCGMSDGSVTLGAVTGGTAPYSYSFNGWGGYSTTTVYNGLSAGSYPLDVKDANGCIYSTTVSISNIPGPTAIAATTTDVSSCSANDGSLTINGVTGGVAPYVYTINGLPYSSTTTYTGLSAGVYTLIVKDANGCIYDTTVTITNPSIAQPTTASVTQPTCAVPTGTIVFTAQSGVEYNIDNGTNYQASPTFSGLPSGTYTLMVRNVADVSCTATASSTVTINTVPNAPATPTTAVVTQPTCANPYGTIVINRQAGIEYSDNNGTTYQASNNFSGLTSGTYTIVVRSFNDNTCSATGASTVTINAQPTPPTVPTFTVIQPNCSQTTGTIIVDSQAGVQYSIDNGATFQASNTFSGVVVGTYTIRVRNLADSTCQATAATTATVNNSLSSGVIGASTTGTYADFNADGFVNVGDVINYQFTLINCEASDFTNVILSNSNMNISGGPLAVLAAGTTDTTTFTGIHVLTQNDINNGSVTVDVIVTGTLNSATVTSVATTTTNLSITDGIKLNAFIDVNGNGVQNSGEPTYTDGQFHYELNNDGIIHNISSSYGQYSIYETNAANSYDVNFTTNNAGYTVNPSSYTNITVVNGSGVTIYNFPVTAPTYSDLRVSIYPSGGPRPGFTYGNYVYIQNIGSQAAPAGTLTFTNDSKVTVTNVSPTATMSATGFTYNYPSFAPNQSQYVFVTIQVPTIPTVQLGNLITNTASISIPAGDVNTANNNVSLTQDVRGSYDPNDKNEAHGPQILHSTFTSTDYLSYTIQFENTGNANAVTVRVNDALDSKLDETSIKMIDASHNYTLDRVGNDLTWHFDGIDLPPSVAGTSIGKGYINFQIKPKAGYAVGNIIDNTAYIYFDFNPAIVTNKFSTEFVAVLGVAGFENAMFSAYPNPTKGIININLKNNANTIDSVIVTDVLGKTVQSNIIKNSNATIDISNLTKGLYFVKIQAEGQVKTLKVVKE